MKLYFTPKFTSVTGHLVEDKSTLSAKCNKAMRLSAGDWLVSGEKCEIWSRDKDGQTKDKEIHLLYHIFPPVRENRAEQRKLWILEENHSTTM